MYRDLPTSSRARSVLSRSSAPTPHQDGKHVCETAGYTFDESKAGARCMNNICDDRQCCLPPITCGNSGGANLPYGPGRLGAVTRP